RRGGVRDARPNFSHRLSGDKAAPGDGGVKGGARAGPAPRRKQHAAIGPGAPKHAPYENRDGRTHLDTWTLAPECESRANGQKTSEEFYRHKTIWRRRHLLAQHRFHVWDAAA